MLKFKLGCYNHWPPLVFSLHILCTNLLQESCRSGGHPEQGEEARLVIPIPEFASVIRLPGWHVSGLCPPTITIPGRRGGSPCLSSSPEALPQIRVLTSVDQIIIRTDYEWDALELLKKQSYDHAKRFDTEFLMMTGLCQDKNRAFTTAGWSRLADITEPGSHLLTMEFLSTLHVETVGKETKIHFRFFNEFFEMLPRDFSNALGFSKKCLLEANALTDDIECLVEWNLRWTSK